MQHYDVHLTIGHNVNDTPKLTLTEVCAAFESVTGVTAYTAIPCKGMWRGTAEESTRIEVCHLADAQAVNLLAAVPTLCAVLEQSEIMTGYYQSHTAFVGASSADAIATA